MQWSFLEELEGEVKDRYDQAILRVYMKFPNIKLCNIFINSLRVS